MAKSVSRVLRRKVFLIRLYIVLLSLILVLALLAALAAVGAWKYTNGNFYALPEQLRTLLTEHVPRPGATLV